MAKEEGSGSDVRGGVGHGPGCGDASGKERSGLVTSIGHFTLKQLQFRFEKLNVRIHTLVDTSSLEFSCRCFALR